MCIRDRVIYEAGTVGTNCYIILKGSVSVIMKKEVRQGKNRNKHIEYELTEINVLYQGDTFGDLCFVTNTPRLSTIYTREMTECAVISKKCFEDITKKDDLKIFTQNAEYIKQIPFFSQLFKNDLINLACSLEARTYKWKQSIFEPGEYPNYLYIVTEGEVIV
eukprot:TRINITY_DN10022_c0_g1_i2.p1 TRINITY_DN10022_c0_g1~~TRINITY_DN10022_c0_g1_i2.p1  ORF type:complete len:163 (+),score=22.70 TRINITY_DN10022_c0_g1_i2:64-552(+)